MKKIIFMLILSVAISVFSTIDKGSGGPDAFGYSWIDSNETGGPVYGWYDISSIGTNMYMGEWDRQTVNMGMSFDFYGTTYTSVDVFSKGYLSFVSGGDVKYENDPIPFLDSPNGVIAPFWEDLDPADQSGAVFYYYDSANSRFIVQFDNVVFYGGNLSNTFQVILNADGKIYFQYKTMREYVDGCTVGIENQGGTDGLEIAFNESYISDGLAVKVYPSDIITDGTFSLSPSSISYGNVTLGDSSVRSFTIYNTHSIEKMTGTITTIAGYTVSEAVKYDDAVSKFLKNYVEYSINPGSSIAYNLAFSPIAAGSYDGFITITSSDTSSPLDSLVVTGSGVVPDIALSSTDTLKVSVYPGGTSSQGFTINNNGLGNLYYSLSSNYLISDVYKNSGGPDNYNYFWKDSNDPTGPDYYWFDISGTGTQIPTLEDEALSSAVSIGFNFNFYGNIYSTVKISSNGFITFGNVNHYIPQILPNTNEPNDIICPYWTDLNPSLQGNIFYYYDSSNERFIVQYNNIANIGTTNNNTFQVILYKTGVVEFHYQQINPYFCTVGIENSTGTDASMVSSGSSYLNNLFAIRFNPVPKWITLNPSSGTVSPSRSQSVSVGISSAGLSVGLHKANIAVNSNDPDSPALLKPVALTVLPIPVPVLVSPSNSSSTTDLTPTFDWSDVTEATSYKIIADNNSDFSSPEIDQTITSSTFTPGVNMAAGTYYWKVRSNIDSASGDYSSAWNVRLYIVPPVPNVTITVVSGNIFMNWDDSVSATNYDIYSCSTPYGTYSLLTNVTVSEYTYTNVSGNSKMFFKVVAKNSTKESPITVEVLQDH